MTIGAFLIGLKVTLFLPLIPAQTFENPQECADAFEAYGMMQPELISVVDAKLWNGWVDRKDVAELMDVNVSDAFQDYVAKLQHLGVIVECAGFPTQCGHPIFEAGIHL